MERYLNNNNNNNKSSCWAPVVHTCNPSYLGGWDREDHGLSPAPGNSLWGPHLQNKRSNCIGGVVQEGECLFCKREDLSSNPSPMKKKILLNLIQLSINTINFSVLNLYIYDTIRKAWAQIFLAYPFGEHMLNYPVLAGPVSFFKPLTPWQQE
jgi:hypothetical protein